MQTISGFNATLLWGLFSLTAVSGTGAQELSRPGAAGALTLTRAREIARQVSAELRAAEEALTAASARERQAGAFPNPTLAYGREQTSAGGVTNSQNIAQLEQRLELGGQRGARRDVANAQRQAAAARVAAAQARLDYEVTRVYARAVAAERRARLIQQAAGAFTKAQRVSQTRLAGGDVSGYENRRLRLEAARYAALRAEALAAQRTARQTLAFLVAPDGGFRGDTTWQLVDTLTPAPLSLALDSLVALATTQRPELRVANLDAQAAQAEARLARRERIPSPLATAGFKSEEIAGSSGTQQGFVAGISIPLPLWDRRTGAVDAARAESRRRTAEAEGLRRQTLREITEAFGTQEALAEQLAALRQALDTDAAPALRAAEVSYAEGEMSLVEWLDAVRAYQDAESSYATLWAEYVTSRAALERAVGIPLR